MSPLSVSLVPVLDDDSSVLPLVMPVIMHYFSTGSVHSAENNVWDDMSPWYIATLSAAEVLQSLTESLTAVPYLIDCSDAMKVTAFQSYTSVENTMAQNQTLLHFWHQEPLYHNHILTHQVFTHYRTHKSLYCKAP